MISLTVRVIGCGLLITLNPQHTKAQPATVQKAMVINAGKTTQEQLIEKLRQEMSFLQHVVKLTPEQNQRLAEFDATKLDENRVKQRKIVPGVDFGNGQARIVIQTSVDPLKLLQFKRAFEKEIKAVLTEDQFATYLVEKKLREDFEIETAVRGILIILDKRLSLSKDQRDALYSSLMKWRGITSFDITPYESSNQYLPAIPDSVLVEHLNESQRSILRSVSRVDFGDQMQQRFQGDFELIR